MDSRVKHIDVAKGIVIAIVVMYHSKLNFYFPEIIRPTTLFMMPVFFLLSGVFFSWWASPKAFIQKKFEALLKPYFAVLILLMLVTLPSAENVPEAAIRQLKGILYGNGFTIRWSPMWFLTHLFAVYVFSYLLFRFAHLDRLGFANLFILLLFLVIGAMGIDLFWDREFQFFAQDVDLQGLPFSIDIILITSSFFILGRLLKNRLCSAKLLLYCI